MSAKPRSSSSPATRPMLSRPLETAAAKSGAMTKGAAGQPVLNPAVAEARQGRLAIGKLLGQLSLPTEDEEPTTATAKRAQKAATARWNRRANTTQQRRKKNG